jgi:hypothetical protein
MLVTFPDYMYCRAQLHTQLGIHKKKIKENENGIAISTYRLLFHFFTARIKPAVAHFGTTAVSTD